MANPNEEEFGLDLEDPNEFLRRKSAEIQWQKAKTANLLAILLVSGVLASLPIHLLTLFLRPEASEGITAVFDKWYALVSPLAGAAVGAYYATRSHS